MSNGINRVQVLGNLCADPVVRYGQSGTAVCNLRVAANTRVKDGDDWKDQAEFFDIVCFGKTGENAGQYLQKGRQVYVDGRLQTRKFQDKAGNDRYRTEVIANEVVFLGGKASTSEPTDPAPATDNSDTPVPTSLPF